MLSMVLTALVTAASGCEGELNKTQQHLRALAEAAKAPSYGVSVDAVEADAEPYRDDHPHVLVEVTSNAIKLLHAELPAHATAAQVRDALRKERAELEVQLAAANGEPAPSVAKTPGLLIISPTARWGSVVAASEGLRQYGVYIVQYLFKEKRPPGLASTGSPRDVEPGLLEKVSERCPKLATLGAPKKGASGANQLEQAAEALTSCGCDFDFAAYRAWASSAFESEPHTGVTVELHPRGAVISAKKSAPWSATAALVIQAARADKPVRFGAK